MEKNMAIMAGGVAFNTGMFMIVYPGGGGALGLIANIRKLEFGVWVFIVADITALCISMAVLLVGITVGPTLWEKIKKRVGMAMFTAVVAMAIAVRQILLAGPLGGELWYRLFVNGVSCVYMSFVCVVIYLVWSESRENQVEAGLMGKGSTQ